MLIAQQDDCNAIAAVFLLNLANDGVVLCDICIMTIILIGVLTLFRHSWLIQGLITCIAQNKIWFTNNNLYGDSSLGILMSTLFKVTAYSIRYKAECLEKDI